MKTIVLPLALTAALALAGCAKSDTANNAAADTVVLNDGAAIGDGNAVDAADGNVGDDVVTNGSPGNSL